MGLAPQLRQLAPSLVAFLLRRNEMLSLRVKEGDSPTTDFAAVEVDPIEADFLTLEEEWLMSVDDDGPPFGGLRRLTGLVNRVPILKGGSSCCSR